MATNTDVRRGERPFKKRDGRQRETVERGVETKTMRQQKLRPQRVKENVVRGAKTRCALPTKRATNSKKGELNTNGGLSSST